MRITMALVTLMCLAVPAAPAVAQTLGTFSWQIEPYCNIVTFTVTADGPSFRLIGYDNDCGAGRTPASGVATPNADGSVTLTFALVAGSGRAGHATARLSPPGYSGPWTDDGGLTGTLRFGPAGGAAGTPRPIAQFQRRVIGRCAGNDFVQRVREDGGVDCASGAGGGAGDITSVTAGAGLTGGGVHGDVMLSLAGSGVGSFQIADGSIAAADVDTTQIQRRVVNVCAAGLFMAAVGQDGVGACSDGTGDSGSTALGTNALGLSIGQNNTAVGHHALRVTTVGGENTAVGSSAMSATTSGNLNTAIGHGALRNNTVGEENTAVGALAMEHTIGGNRNVAVGNGAMIGNLTGVSNVAVGFHALFNNETGGSNVGVGHLALSANVAGLRSVAIGAGALEFSTVSDNLAVGFRAGRQLTTGRGNTAVGTEALPDATSGEDNIAIGNLAGGAITTGSHNIHIGYQGVANESDTIRIGVAQDRAFITGIRGTTTGAANAVAVMVDSNGQLGTISSSRRTKDDIHDMGQASAGLFKLRPVTFRYLKPYADGSTPRDYGLIAEEVAAVYPDLVVRNQAGEVETVQYHKLVPMLLNELQRLHSRIEAIEAELARAKPQPR